MFLSFFDFLNFRVSKYLFDRGDYDSLQEDLQKIEWKETIDGNESINTLWRKFATILRDKVEKHVPKRKPSNKTKKFTTLHTCNQDLRNGLQPFLSEQI